MFFFPPCILNIFVGPFPTSPVCLTDGQRRERVLLHVDLLQVVGPGEDAVGDAVAEVVLHVQHDGVDELAGAAGREAVELVAGQRDRSQVLQGAGERKGEIGANSNIPGVL